MPPSLKELALKYIREKIASGEWKPGYRLSDFVLCKEMGISRTPVREAINQLAAEGLAEFRPREGAFVKSFDRREIEELYELREILECHCARKAAIAPGDALLKRLSDDLARMLSLESGIAPGRDSLDKAATEIQRSGDLDFHQALIEAAGNSKVERIVSESRVHTRLFSLLDKEMSVAAYRGAIGFHRRLLDAIKAHDQDAAENAMREHIRRGAEEFFATVASHETDNSSLREIPPQLRKFV